MDDKGQRQLKAQNYIDNEPDLILHFITSDASIQKIKAMNKSL